MLLLLVEELLFFDERRQSVHLRHVQVERSNDSEFSQIIEIIISALKVSDELELESE